MYLDTDRGKFFKFCMRNPVFTLMTIKQLGYLHVFGYQFIFHCILYFCAYAVLCIYRYTLLSDQPERETDFRSHVAQHFFGVQNPSPRHISSDNYRSYVLPSLQIFKSMFLTTQKSIIVHLFICDGQIYCN